LALQRKEFTSLVAKEEEEAKEVNSRSATAVTQEIIEPVVVAQPSLQVVEVPKTQEIPVQQASSSTDVNMTPEQTFENSRNLAIAEEEEARNLERAKLLSEHLRKEDLKAKEEEAKEVNSRSATAAVSATAQAQSVTLENAVLPVQMNLHEPQLATLDELKNKAAAQKLKDFLASHRVQLLQLLLFHTTHIIPSDDPEEVEGIQR
jgi:hypothetical protein